MDPDILPNVPPSEPVTTPENLEMPGSPENTAVQSDADSDKSQTNNESDESLWAPDSESTLVLTPTGSQSEVGFAESWNSLNILPRACKLRSNNTTAENQNPLSILTTACELKSNDAITDSTTSSHSPRSCSAWHDIGEGVLESLPRKVKGKRQQLEQKLINVFTNKFDLLRTISDGPEEDIESSDIPKNDATKTHVGDPNSAAERERRKARGKQENTTKEEKSKSKVAKTNDALPQKVTYAAAKRNRRKATKEQQEALEEEDRNVIAEAKREKRKDLMALRRRRAREHKEIIDRLQKELADQLQKVDEIKKAEEIRKVEEIRKAEEVRKAALKQDVREAKMKAQLAIIDYKLKMAQARNAINRILGVHPELATRRARPIDQVHTLVHGTSFPKHTQAYKSTMVDMYYIMNHYVAARSHSVFLYLMEVLREKGLDGQPQTKAGNLADWLVHRCWLLQAKKYSPEIPIPSILKDWVDPHEPDLRTLLNCFRHEVGMDDFLPSAVSYLYLSDAWCIEQERDSSEHIAALIAMMEEW